MLKLLTFDINFIKISSISIVSLQNILVEIILVVENVLEFLRR
nr:hypothetical protein [Flavobacterium covae]